MHISRLTRLSTVEWEDIPSCMVHLAGCSFRCPYCSFKDDLEQKDGIPEEDVLSFIADSDIEGVIITGGEPLIQKNLYKFLSKIKKLGKKIMLETNGCDPDALDDLIGAKLVDFVSMDIKADLRQDEYAMNAHVIIDPEFIERSIKIIMESGVDYEFTTTVVPIHIKEDDIEAICSNIRGAKCYRLIQFKPGNCLDGSMNMISPYNQKVIKEMEKKAKMFVKKVKVSGI